MKDIIEEMASTTERKLTIMKDIQDFQQRIKTIEEKEASTQ